MKFARIGKKKFIVAKTTDYKGVLSADLIPYDEGEYDKIVNEIVERIQNTVDAKTILKQALTNLDWNDVKRIQSALRHKGKVRMRRGCLEIAVGNQIIPIVR